MDPARSEHQLYAGDLAAERLAVQAGSVERVDDVEPEPMQPGLEYDADGYVLAGKPCPPIREALMLATGRADGFVLIGPPGIEAQPFRMPGADLPRAVEARVRAAIEGVQAELTAGVERVGRCLEVTRVDGRWCERRGWEIQDALGRRTRIEWLDAAPVPIGSWRPWPKRAEPERMKEAA